MAAEAQIRGLILDGTLLPGQKIHQGDLAARLGSSRIPVREGLASLEAEGLVEHRANTGYTVVVPTAEALGEIYLMRGFLETELVRAVDLTRVDVERMEAANRELAHLDPGTEFERYRELNRDFHFAVFDASPLRLVHQEVNRIWNLSEFYRSLYIHVPGAATHVVHDHEEMITAIRAHDLDALARVSAEHRNATLHALSPMLTRGRQ